MGVAVLSNNHLCCKQPNALSPLFGSGFAKVAHTLIESMSVFSTHSHSLGYLVVRYGFDPIRQKRLLK
jgi:hypothetical protein